MLEKVKISIVTISYNQSLYIEETILSVLDQDYYNIEYIIVDGGSTDGSKEIIEKYRSRISNFIYEKDKGPSDALNKGFQLATGDFIMYLNSDDLLNPDSVSSIVSYIKRNPYYDVYYGHGEIQFDYDQSRIKVYSDKWDLNMYRHKFVSVFQQSTVVRKDAYIKTSGFNIENRDNWDGEMLVDLSLAGAKFNRFKMHIGVFRMYPLSISGGLTNEVRYCRTKKRIFDKISKETNSIGGNRAFFLMKKIFLDPSLFFKKLKASMLMSYKMKKMKEFSK